MTFNRFYVSIIVQVILIGITSSVFVWTYSQDYMLITRYSLLLLWVFQIIILIRFINKISRDLKKFLLSIKYKDTSIKFNTNKRNPFHELHESFTEILGAFRDVRIEKESEYHFFQTSIEHVNVGLLAFNTEGQIKLCNQAARNLLGVRSLVNISSLKKIKTNLPKILNELKPNHPEILTLKNENILSKLSLSATNLKVKDEIIKLISIQNITNELEQGEMDAWQKLIRVITHEILNSVSPITLLSSGLINIFERDGEQIPLNKLEEKNIKDSLTGLRVIQNRSKRLSAFVDDYRSSMQLPAPIFEDIKVNELFESLQILFKEELIQKNIKIEFKCASKDVLIADEKLIEQVLINLINNAIHFIKGIEYPEVQIIFSNSENQSKIIVRDNGPGIDAEIIEQIFIPFFSTKEKGSGIGLSLSRQIMRMHNGSISVQSIPSKETTFTLQF